MTHSTRWPAAYVLDDDPQALAVIRSLGRRGVPVVCLTYKPHGPGSASRFCSPVVLPRVSLSPERWLEVLLEAGAHASTRPVLIPTTDRFLEFVDRHRKALANRFHLVGPTGAALQRVLDKGEQYRVAAAAGVPTPRTYPLNGPLDLDGLLTRVGLPCVVKPTISHRWVDAFRNGTKLTVITSRDQLRAAYDAAAAKQLRVLLQEWIPGPEDQLYSATLYRGRSGVTLGMGTDRKLRQFPVSVGNGSLRVTDWQPRVAALGQRTAEALGFTGIANVEFHRDPRDGEFKLMELNGRPNSSLALMADSGVDLPWIAYQDAIGAPVRPVLGNRPKVKWWYAELDLLAYGAARRRNTLTVWQWVRSWWDARSFAYFAWDDLKPCTHAIRKSLWRWRAGVYRAFRHPALREEPRSILYMETGSGVGGSAHSLYQLIRSLDHHRFRPIVVACRGGSAIQQIRDLGVAVHVLVGPRTARGGYLRLVWRWLRYELPRTMRMIVVIRRERVALIHLNNDVYSSVAGFLAARLTGTPVVCHLRLTRPPTRFERQLGRWAGVKVVLTQEAQMFYRRWWPQERIVCIPNGVELPPAIATDGAALRSSLHIPSTQRVVGLVARCVAGKGYEEFLQAAKIVSLQRPEATFVIVGNGRGGDPAYEARLQQFSHSLGLNGALVWAGWQPRADDVYRSLDIVVQASSTFPEGLSRVVLEAMSYGRPVVATDIVGNREAVLHDVTGLLVQPGDAQALAGAIRTLLDDPQRAQRYGEQGRRRAAEHFSLQVQTQRLQQVYGGLLHVRRSAAQTPESPR